MGKISACDTPCTSLGPIIQIVHTMLHKMASNMRKTSACDMLCISLGHIIQIVHTMLYKMAPNVIKMSVCDAHKVWATSYRQFIPCCIKMASNMIKMLGCITTVLGYYVMYVLLYVLKLYQVPETDKIIIINEPLVLQEKQVSCWKTRLSSWEILLCGLVEP